MIFSYFNAARGLYPHVGSRTSPVLYRSETGLTHAAATVGADRIRPQPDGTERLGEWYTLGAKRPCLPWKGRWLSVSETGGVCSSNRAVQETPQSAYGCQLPFQGRPWQNQNPPPFNAQLNFPTLRADSIRPYRAYAFIRVLANIRGYGRIISAPTVACAGRFLSGNEPGGSGNQRMGTSPVRHCPAALPPRAQIAHRLFIPILTTRM